MAPHAGLKGRLGDLKRRLRVAAEEAQATSGGTAVDRFNVADRVNVVVAKNLGRRGSTEADSTKQTTRVRQHGGETFEESQTTSTSHTSRGKEEGDVQGTS